MKIVEIDVFLLGMEKVFGIRILSIGNRLNLVYSI
jgi:hypothetical protein